MNLRTENLSAGYAVRGERRVILDGADITVSQGEVIALIGPNGSGKTTLLKTLAGRLAPLGGTVILGDKDMSSMKQTDIASQLAILTTERISPALATAADIVEAGRYPYTDVLGRITKRDREIVASALDTVHASELADVMFDTLSDGQRQRVLLARAIAQQPQVMILDEPASYLDIRHKLEIFSILRGLAAEGIAIIMSVHETDLAMKTADRIICVKDGRIAGQGTPEEIFSGGFIPSLYDIPERCFDNVSGNVELIPAEGAPKAFVIGSCGFASPVYRRLRREGTAFAAGILHTNDIDYTCAAALAAEVISLPPFAPADGTVIDRALSLVQGCGTVIAAQQSFSEYDCNRQLLEAIQGRGISVTGVS